MTAAGGMIGVSIAVAGAAAGAALPDLQLPLAIVLGAAAFAYALHELELLRLPVPGRDWQVPADWVRLGYYRSAALFGGIVGLGVFTRVPFAILPVLLAWLFVAGNPLYGALAGLAYGATRAVSIYSAASASDADELVGLTHRLMALAPPLHRATGLFLAIFAAYLLAAPYLP